MEKNELIEALADLEHEQWIAWSKNIAETENISSGRLARWQALWVPYSELEEEVQELDREWAERAVKVSRDVFKRMADNIIAEMAKEILVLMAESINDNQDNEAYLKGLKDAFEVFGQLLYGDNDLDGVGEEDAE